MNRPLAGAALIALAACASPAPARKGPEKPALPLLSTPKPPGDAATPAAPPPVLIRNATVLTAAGQVFEKGHVLLVGGLIASVGPGDVPAPEGAAVVDATGKFVTPGLIDTHSHLGVYPYPGAEAHLDGNEMTAPTTAGVWAEHAFWPQDPGLWRALAGGVTTIQVLPGSANLIGGRSFTAKLRPGVSARELRFPGAPQGVKMACGENPKRVYGERKSPPMTRMGNVAGFRAAFQRALEYRRALERYERDLAVWKERQEARKAGKEPPATDKPDDPPDPPVRDLGNETLAAVLDGELLVHVHCYRADDMHAMLDLAEEFGLTIRSFHHGLEAYKLKGRLASKGVAVSTWVDWWGFKLEAFDGIPQNVALLGKAGVRPILHSDSAREIRRLNQEAAKARTAGRKLGLDFTDDEVLRWVTANPAWALGVDDRTGTLERGKMADVVVWSGSPFSVYSLAEQVYVDGAKVWDRAADPRLSDFELGIVDPREQP